MAAHLVSQEEGTHCTSFCKNFAVIPMINKHRDDEYICNLQLGCSPSDNHTILYGSILTSTQLRHNTIKGASQKHFCKLCQKCLE